MNVQINSQFIFLSFADMKLNWRTQIIGQKVILVPYCEKHVPEYHEWMKSPELQRLTGSEPLTYEEEIGQASYNFFSFLN